MHRSLGLMDGKNMANVLLIALVILVFQLHSLHGRTMGSLMNQKPSPVMLFHQGLHTLDAGYPGMETRGHTESNEEEGFTKDNEEEDHRYPADELLQIHNADGSKSYILGGY